MKISFYIAYLFFMGGAKHLPESFSKIQLGQKKIRGWCASKIMKSTGNNINVEKGAIFSRRCSLGNNSGIGINCTINGDVRIGDNVMMGPNVTIYTQNHCIDRIDIPMNLQGATEEKPVIIGDDVWIGSNVIILPGVVIESHSVIGAGSVVTKRVPAYCIVAGNPARIVKSRK